MTFSPWESNINQTIKDQANLFIKFVHWFYALSTEKKIEVILLGLTSTENTARVAKLLEQFVPYPRSRQYSFTTSVIRVFRDRFCVTHDLRGFLLF